MKTYKLVPLFLITTVLLLTPQQQPAVAQAQPAGAKTPNGMVYVFPSVFGKGSITLSRESGYLRVDIDTAMPYDSGDGKKYLGAAAEVIISADGKEGRRMLAFPSPLWEPDPVTPTFRHEQAFTNNERATRLPDASSFAATGNVKFWDRYQSTMWINLAKLNIAGNSADKISNDWKLAVICGNYQGSAVFPEGINVDEPTANTTGYLSVKLTDLPERPKPRSDPFLFALQREKTYGLDLLKAGGFSQGKKYKQAFDTFKELVKTYPEHLAPRYACWMLADRLPQVIKEDMLPYLKDFVEACPSQLFWVNLYITRLMVNNRDQDAFAYYTSAATSPLASIPARKALLDISWAYALVDNGYSAKAEAMLPGLEANDAVKNNGVNRVEIKTIKARICEAKGDSKGAAAIYNNMLSEDRSVLFSKVIDPETKKEREEPSVKATYTTELIGLHDLAAQLWDAELAMRADEAKDPKYKLPRVTFETTKGKFVVELFQDDAANSVANVVSLVRKKFYDGLTFHNYSPGFMIQGGCPKGDGTGFPGYRIKTEGPPNNRRNFFRGTFALSNFSPNTDTEGSQFIVTTQNSRATLALNGKLVVVGRVIEGMEVVDMLRKTDKIKSATVANLRDGNKYEPVTEPESK